MSRSTEILRVVHSNIVDTSEEIDSARVTIAAVNVENFTTGDYSVIQRSMETMFPMMESGAEIICKALEGFIDIPILRSSYDTLTETANQVREANETISRIDADMTTPHDAKTLQGMAVSLLSLLLVGLQDLRVGVELAIEELETRRE